MTAETGRAFVPFLRKNVMAAHALVVAWAAQPIHRGADRQDLAGETLKGHLKELSVVLVGDRRMSALHEEFMDMKGPTDVLTFPLEADALGRAISGEVILCVPEALRQARSRRILPRLELLLYAVHGMLHLLGYDDTTDRAFRTMHHTEDSIMTELGFGPVFSARVASPQRGGNQ